MVRGLQVAETGLNSVLVSISDLAEDWRAVLCSFLETALSEGGSSCPHRQLLVRYLAG